MRNGGLSRTKVTSGLGRIPRFHTWINRVGESRGYSFLHTSASQYEAVLTLNKAGDLVQTEPPMRTTAVFSRSLACLEKNRQAWRSTLLPMYSSILPVLAVQEWGSPYPEFRRSFEVLLVSARDPSCGTGS
jgi:hypothetical protein